MARGPLLLAATCALIIGLASCQRAQGSSGEAAAWSPAAGQYPGNLVSQARANDEQQSDSVEYYDEEYYDDEPVSSKEEREPKAIEDKSAGNGTLLEDAYYYDEDYEEEPLEEAKGSDEAQKQEKPVAETPDEKQPTEARPEVAPTTSTTTTTVAPASVSPEKKAEEKPGSILIGEAIVSVVTTKSVVNGTYSVPETTTDLPSTSTMTQETPTSVEPSSTTGSTTEATPTSSTTEFAPSSTIHASVQTGRSVSGARFLPFASVDKLEQLDSTESIIDKLDRVQSELSSGFLANNRFVPRRYNKKPFSSSSLTLPPTSTVAPTSSPIAPLSITSITKRPRAQTTLDDIAAFLPKDFSKSSVRTSTTAAPLTKRPKIQTTLDDVEAFLPKDFPKSGGYRTSTTKRPKFQTTLDDVEAFLPKDFPKSGFRGGYKRPSYKTSSSSTTKEVASSTERSTASTSSKALTTQDISAFLPPGYKLKKEDATTEKTLLLSEILAKTKLSGTRENSTIASSTTERVKSIQDLFAKSEVDIAALLPPGYKADTSKPTKSEPPVQDLLSKSNVDISALLPPGFADKNGTQQPDQEAKTGGSSFKVVFPSRPGGRKPIHKITTPSSANRAAETAAPRIQKGWPTRATTEFTGWPSSSTTPISIEKLLEAARTATVSSANISVVPTTSEISSTSSTTTTTTTTLRPTTPGLCDGDCEVAGTIKIVENATWLPELLDRNTREWQDLAEEIEREMNLVFAKSPVLRKWFRNIRIDSFSQGSVLVDYFVELSDLKEKISTQQLKVIFHDSLRTFNFDNPMEARPKGPVKLGKFTIDPKATDFVVIPRVAAPKVSEDENRLIPQWAIAVIVIGVGGLLFIIVFGVSVLVNRQQGSKLKPSISAMYEDEVSKNVMSHAAPPSSRPAASDYQKSDSQTIWNDPGWHDKPFESTSHKILVDGLPYERKYNPYDSWKSEWNGYYDYSPSQASGSNFSRHHPDYDINF